jgi:hypothetical protein
MANERAKDHWDKACQYLEDAHQASVDGEINQAIVCTGLGELALKLAAFAADHHALVAGIDENAPINPASPVGAGGAAVWGAVSPPPLPAHIAAQVRQAAHMAAQIRQGEIG